MSPEGDAPGSTFGFRLPACRIRGEAGRGMSVRTATHQTTDEISLLHLNINGLL